MSSSQTSADSGSSNFLMDDRFERGIGNSSATSESPNSIDTINRQIPETLLSTALITPENAFTHASNRRGDIEQLLEDGGYNGHFSIHAGFNRRSIELQRDYQEIIIALSHAISDDLCASLEKAVQPFTCHILALPGSPVAEGFNEERSFPTRGCAQQPGGGGSASGYKGRSEGRSATRRSRDGGSGGGGGRSNDSESDDNDNDKRGKGGDRRGGGSKGHGDDDPGIHSGGIKRVGEGIFIVGIDSKLEFADGKQDLCILSKVKARIAEKGCHDDDWPGQILEVDVEPLQLKFKTFMDYKVGLGQVQISAPSVSQMAILNNHPHTISHEECVPREGRITKGFALSLSPSSSPAKATFSAQSEKKVEIFFNPWAVTSQSPRQIDDQDMVGQAWNYLPNPDKSFSDDDLRELTPGPTLRYGLTRPFVYPVLRVDLNVLWSLPRDNFKGIFRPAYLDLIHAVTLTVDLSKVPGPKDFNFGAGSKVFDKLAKAISDKGCHYLPEHTLPSTSTKAKCTLVQAIEGVTNGIGRKLKLEPKEEASKGLLLNAMKRRVPPQSLATPTVGDYTFDPAVDMPPGLP
ncbi:hypothetical protein H0H92_009958 [Tricholoma furcatifolium]|nr:hypothetical protein H0H92_009958 [Tricholoma furcatifolium]